MARGRTWLAAALVAAGVVGVARAEVLEITGEFPARYREASLLHSLSIDRFDFDGRNGTIAGRHRLVTFASGEGAPNGLTVDSEGNLWAAATGAGEVRCFTPDGHLIRRIGIATPGATSCAFGGADGGHLFITSLGRRMPDVARSIGFSEAMMANDGPSAGDLFVCRPGCRGPAATPFAG